MKFTKIVATISDKRCTPEFLRQLYEAGMNVVRINSAHITPEGMRAMVQNVRQVSESIAIMVDTKGPEIRTTVLADAEHPLLFAKGDEVEIKGDPSMPTTSHIIYINYTGINDVLQPGDHMLIDDGVLDFKILEVKDGTARAISCNNGKLGSRKTVNLPGIDVPLPSVSERDREFIALAAELDVDFIAHSFVRSVADVKAVQEVIAQNHSEMSIIAKIENQQGIDNFDSILEECYGVMIARGDLGIEVPAERIPGLQRMIISKCMAAHKPVIVATQMLHSMINNPRPTRAEVTDVAEAVYQQADAVMLSGETASGEFPVESVETMARIAHEVESTIAQKPHDAPTLPDAHVTSFLARQAVMSELRVCTKAIVTDAFHGRTARFISSFRGSQPVFAICGNIKVARRLALSYGIIPYYYEHYHPTQRYPVKALRKIIGDGRLNADDRIAYLGSLGGFGATFLEINTINDILAYTANPKSRMS